MGLREATSRYERPGDPGTLEISVTPRGSVDVDMARRYADLGVHRLVIQPSDMERVAMNELITSAAQTLIGRV